MENSQSRGTNPPRPSPRWLCVFELDDSAGPRRVPGKPRIRVEQKAIRPGPDLKAWLDKTKASKRPELVRVRYDLMPRDHQHGGRLRPYKYPHDKEPLDEALKDLREKLRCQGFTVDGVRDVYSLYVIEFDDTHLTKKPEGYRGYVYVGQTELSPEERAHQHELGPKYQQKKKPNHSRAAHNHFRRLALELLPPKFRKKLLCRSSALRAEHGLRLYFEAKGYEVEGGKDLLKKKQPFSTIPSHRPARIHPATGSRQNATAGSNACPSRGKAGSCSWRISGSWSAPRGCARPRRAWHDLWGLSWRSRPVSSRSDGGRGSGWGGDGGEGRVAGIC